MDNMDSSPVPLELAVVIPVFNECENVHPVLENLAKALLGIKYEVIFVDDDSLDGTADCIRAVARRDPYIRVLQRISRRGLASACLEGMMSTASPYIAVMDADLQHDERILPQMLAKIQSERLDVVIATRNALGGAMGEFSRHRVLLSNLGLRLSRWITHTDISDPMSGFFIVTRDCLELVVRSTSGIGFKILLDLIASAKRPLRVAEVPYTFRERLHGSSKLDIIVGLEYLQLLLDKKIGSLVPVRFLLFSTVGAAGVLLSFAMLYVLVSLFAVDFLKAQTITTFIAMTQNFFLNNAMTYRDRRLRGRRIFVGLGIFYFACSLGAAINLGIATSFHRLGLPWYIAGTCGLS